MTVARRYDWAGTPLGQGSTLPRRIYRLLPLPPTSPELDEWMAG